MPLLTWGRWGKVGLGENQKVSYDGVNFEIPWYQAGIWIFTMPCALRSCAIETVIYTIIFLKTTFNQLAFFFSSVLSNNIHNKVFVDYHVFFSEYTLK